MVLALGFVAGLATGASRRSTVTVTETFRTLVTTTATETLRTLITTTEVLPGRTFTLTEVRTIIGTVTVQTTVTRDFTQVSEICFSRTMNCASIIIWLIDSAQRSVLVAVYVFTSDPLADALIRAHQRGVEVRVVIERGEAEGRGSEYERLKSAGILIRLDGNSGLMHHKFMVIDEQIVVTGSYNWSAAAEDRNDENVVAIDDREIASLYVEEFERVWNQASD